MRHLNVYSQKFQTVNCTVNLHGLLELWSSIPINSQEFLANSESQLISVLGNIGEFVAIPKPGNPFCNRCILAASSACCAHPLLVLSLFLLNLLPFVSSCRSFLPILVFLLSSLIYSFHMIPCISHIVSKDAVAVLEVYPFPHHPLPALQELQICLWCDFFLLLSSLQQASCWTLLSQDVSWNWYLLISKRAGNCCLSNISKTNTSVSPGSKHEKTDERIRPQAKCFYCFWVFENLMKHKARLFEI